MTLLQSIFDGLDTIRERGDPVTQQWPLVQNPEPAIYCLVLYVVMVLVGPKIMSKRKPVELKNILIIYNLGTALLNLRIFSLVVKSTFKLKYSWACQPLEVLTTPTHIQMASGIWLFYISKLFEFIDTLFLILRKKSSHLTLLHVYHHSTMFVIMWLIIKLHPGGIAFTGCVLNSAIHIIMYTYYGLAAMGPSMQKYLWWKKYLTQIQLLQFVAGTTIYAIGWAQNCKFPVITKYLVIPYLATLTLLFSNFYYQTYKKKQKMNALPCNQQRNVHSTLDKKAISNGTVLKSHHVE